MSLYHYHFVLFNVCTFTWFSLVNHWLCSAGMVLVSGSVECIAIYDLDSLTLRYNLAGPGHSDNVNDIQLLVSDDRLSLPHSLLGI